MTNDLDIILSEGESYTVEFKVSADKSLPSEVCAFANASGGKVFIGVDDRGHVVGTDVSNAARSRIQDTVNKIEPRLNVSIDVIDNIVALTVPEGTHKPYSCPTGFYLRSGPNSQKLDRDSIIDFFQSEGRVRYDEIIRDDLPIDELFNESAFKRYVRAAKISGVLEREAILKNLNCTGMSGGKMCFTNAGALFFRVNDEDVLFRHAGIVCALYKGTGKTNILDAKELSGDIVSNVDNAIIFLKKHLRLSYKIEGLRRENILELPEDALREAVVNAACHRDYFEKGSRVMVEIFDDRVDIVSPGGVCKGITPENFGTVTITRNPIIASMFFRIAYIEQMGTGIGRMRNATREANVAEPKFEFAGFFKVTFKRSEAESSIGRQSAANRSLSAAATDRKRAVISYLEENGQARVADFAGVIGLSDGRVRALLREMVGDGTIEKIGDKRYAHYALKPRGRAEE
ncbi:MAG: helix-turn-helix domain-containing protein [Gracilibacteraceae bacterium]|jgi:ATP-dependent DNA helicase RecG|nr:helix-turn-helix domain-containing protein [Gracilibacteraceae bacterium]